MQKKHNNQQKYSTQTVGNSLNQNSQQNSRKSYTTEVKKSYPQIQETVKGELVLTQDFIDKVNYLCSKINTVEWSGVLFYEVENQDEFDLTDPKSIKMVAKDIYLMDKGSGAATDYEFGPELVDAFIKKPELEDMRMGHIHSHHSMDKLFAF